MALSYYELLHKDDDEEKEKTKVKSFDDLSLREKTMLRYRTLSQNDLFDQREQAKKVAEAELDNIYKRYGKDRNTLTDVYTDFSSRTSDNYIDNYKNNYIAQSIADKLKSESNILTNTSDFAEGTYLGAKGFVSSSLDAGKQAELMVGGVLGGNLNADKLTKISQGKLGKDDPEYAKLSELYAKYGNNEKVADLYEMVTNTKKYYRAPIEIQRLTDSVNELRRADEYKLWKNTYTADDDYDLQRYYTKNELSYDDGIGKALNAAAPVVGNILIPGALGAAAGSAVGSTNAIRSMKAAGDIAKASQIVRNVNTAVSLASMGPSVRGTAFNQAINDGANTNEAFVYSILSEALELGTELLGGEKVNALLGQTVATTPMGKLTNKLINKANIKNNAARMMISWISNIKAEAMEEKISAVLEPIIAAGTYGKEMPSPAEYIEGIYTSGLESVIPTMILGGFGQVRINHSINKIQQDMTNLITNDPRVSMHLTDAEKTELIKKLNFISENAKLGIEQNYDELENEVKSEAKAKGYDEQLYEIEQAIGEKVKTNTNRINNLQQVYNQGENGEYVLTEDERAKALEFLVENNRLPTTNTTFKTAQELLDQEKRGTVTYKNIDAINQELAKVRAENPDITNIEAVTELSKIDENIKSLIDYYLNGKGETVFVNPTANGETIYGFTDRGTQNVYIDINQSTKDKIATAWHEIGHQLKLRVPELYNEFIDKAKITDNEITRYNNQLSKPKSKEEVLEEMFGDYLGKLLSSKENSNKLEDNAMSLVEKIKEIGGKLSNKVTGSEVDNSRLSVYNLDIGSYLDADILNDKELENKVFETLKSLKNVNQVKEATKVTEEIVKNRPKPTMETAKKEQTDNTMSRIKERYEKIKKSGGGMELVKRMIAEELGVDRKKASAKINEIYDELTGETKYAKRKVERKREPGKYSYKKITDEDKATLEHDFYTNMEKYFDDTGIVDFPKVSYIYEIIGDRLYILAKYRGSKNFINGVRSDVEKLLNNKPELYNEIIVLARGNKGPNYFVDAIGGKGQRSPKGFININSEIRQQRRDDAAKDDQNHVNNIQRRIKEGRPSPKFSSRKNSEQGSFSMSKEEEKNALKDKLRKLVARVQEEYSNVEGLSKEEAEQYIKLNREASDIIYNLEKNYYKDISEKNIKDERLTSLDKNVYVQARKDLLSNKDIYDAIEEASFGVFLNSDTPVDAIMEGKNKEVTAEELYNTFNKTRELLRKQYGDTITLYRVEGLQKSKATKNYGSSLAYTKQYGSNVKPYNIKVKDIIAINTNRSGTYEDIIVANNGIDNYLKKNPTSNPDTRYSSRKNNDNLSWVPKKYQERVEGLTTGEDLSDEMPYLLELAKGWGLYERSNTSIPVNSKKEALQFIKEAEYFGEETPKKQPWKGQKKAETSKNRVLPKPVAQEDIINNQLNKIAEQQEKIEKLEAENKGLKNISKGIKSTGRQQIRNIQSESNKMLKTGRETELKMKGQLERAGKKYDKLSQLALDIKYEEQLERKSRADGINFPREYKDLFIGLRNTKMPIQEAYDLTKDIYEESQAVNKSIDDSIKILRELRKSKVYNKIPNELKARIDEYEKIWSGSRQQSDLTLAKRVLNSLEARELLGTVPISKAVRKQIMSMEGYGWESGKGSVSLQELFNGSKELALRFKQELEQLQEDVEKEMARNRRAEKAKELSTRVEQITNEIQDVINEKSSSKLSNLRKDNNIPVAALMTLKTEIQALMGGNINTSLMFLNDSLQNAEIRQKTATVDVYEILSEFMQDSKGLNKLIHSEKWRTDLEKTLSRKADYVDTGITIKGQPLKIPTSMIMSLYMHSLNDDNMMHITGGIVSITTDDKGNTTTKSGKGKGIVIPNEALYKSGKVDQAYDKGRLVTLTPEQVNKIINKLTPEQKAFCEGVKEVFKYTTDLINTVSRKVLGYDIATVENYFPLVVWERAEHKSDTPQTSLDAQPNIDPLDYMLGAGWLQERVTSFAAIKLENIAEVLNRVVNKATAFYGYAEAFRDNSIILDTFNEDGWKTNKYGEPTQTLKKAISNLGSNFLRDYYTLADFITGRKSLAEEGKLRGLMAANTLTFNIGTWLTQPMSFFNTLKYFSTKEFAQSVMPHNNHIKLNNMIRDYYKELGIDKNNVSDFELAREFIALATPSLERRGIGFRKPLMTQLFNKTLSDRIGAKGISLFDDIAVTAIARMTAYSLSLDPTLKFGSDEYFKQLGTKLSQILVETQPETSQVNRANMFRKGGIWQGLTLFGTPANQIFNNFLQSAMDMNYQRTHGSKESIEKARNNLIKSVVGIVASSFSVAWIRALREAFRAGDDDDVELQDRVLAQFIVSLLSPTVVGDEIATWLLAKQKFGGTSFYDFTTPDTNYVQRLYNVADKVYAMMFNDNISPTKKTTDIIKALGSVTPIDTRSLMRIFEGVYKTIAPDEYKTYSLSQNNDAYKAYLKHSDTDMATFLKAYDATRTKTLEAKYGYHKADKAKGIKSNLKECREKALKDVLKDQSEVDKYMEILFGYKK